MEYRQHDNTSLLDEEEHGIRKSAHPDTPGFAVRDGETLRMLLRQVNCAINFSNKLRPETCPAPLVPQRCLIDLVLRCAPKDNR